MRRWLPLLNAAVAAVVLAASVPCAPSAGTARAPVAAVGAEAHGDGQAPDCHGAERGHVQAPCPCGCGEPGPASPGARIGFALLTRPFRVPVAVAAEPPVDVAARWPDSPARPIDHVPLAG